MKYEIRSPLHHDGVAYGIGYAINADLLSAEQIDHLTATGTLVPAAEHPSPAQHEDGGMARAPAETPPPASPAVAVRKGKGD